ncbi:MAG: hypothetical protein CMP84_16600 [Gammaproteobacteria bacterium]|jgi:hypothetical protein|nr:hypothetical protein [Gammaproteobacteria bacterium]|tara:strand:- start:886 stop:1110 length:225 start_codon:yes stop_codon:yes gene_type:complete
MRRGKKTDIVGYIDIRISQLLSDMDKAKDDYDKQWYNRIIQELSWARSQEHDCYMHDLNNWKERYGNGESNGGV